MIQVTDAPDIRPSRHGLVECGNVVSDDSGRWENGISFSPNGCYSLGATQADCPPMQKADLQTCVDAAVFRPYVLSVGVDWSTMDRGYDPKEVARKHLDVGTSAMLELLAYQGSAGWAVAPAIPNPTFLADATVLPGAPSAEALGQIEAALLGHPDATGSGGTIWMSPPVAAQLSNSLFEDGGCLRTISGGNKVIVANFGWNTTDNSAVKDIVGHAGDVDVYLGDIFYTEADESYRRNEIWSMAERLALVIWNPCAVFRVPALGSSTSGAHPTLGDHHAMGLAVEQDLSHQHDQTTAATTWTIDHDLGAHAASPGYRPNVTIVDANDNEIEGDVAYPSDTQVVVTFTTPQAGTAYLS